MSAVYDTYYKIENLFGEPYPELIGFFNRQRRNGRILDLGSGQGRDSIPLARLGYHVVGVDNSEVGIEQMNHVAASEMLGLKGIVGDIYKVEDFEDFDYILLDNMLHFNPEELETESAMLNEIINKIRTGSQVVICIQDTGIKASHLQSIIDSFSTISKIHEEQFTYTFTNIQLGHESIVPYRMIVLQK